MGDKSKIEWTEASWNPVLGCSKVSPGCQNCYAVTMSHRVEQMGNTDYSGLTVLHPNNIRDWSGKVVCLEDRLEIPLRWKRPRKIFVNSMSDLFHKDVPFEFIDKVYGVMSLCPQHVFQVLTKRPERALAFYEWYAKQYGVWPNKPFPNVWLGTSVENQATADERIPHLLQTPAAVRWLSCEPLLGPVQLKQNDYSDSGHGAGWIGDLGNAARQRGIDWLVCGGESGPKARPMHPDWARGLRDQCQKANVPFFFKQWGEYGPTENGLLLGKPNGSTIKVYTGFGEGNLMTLRGKANAGRLLDGVEHNEYPA